MNDLAYILIALMVFQQIFWMWQFHKMINKMMSGTYREYLHAKEKKKEPEEFTEDFSILEDLRIN